MLRVTITYGVPGTETSNSQKILLLTPNDSQRSRAVGFVSGDNGLFLFFHDQPQAIDFLARGPAGRRGSCRRSKRR